MVHQAPGGHTASGRFCRTIGHQSYALKIHFLGTAPSFSPTDSAEAEAPKGFTPVETMCGSEIEYRDGGSAYEQSIPISHPLRVCQRERYDVVEVRENDRAQSLRRCSETGASRVDAGSKGDRRPDQAAVGPVGPAGIPNPTT